MSFPDSQFLDRSHDDFQPTKTDLNSDTAGVENRFAVGPGRGAAGELTRSRLARGLGEQKF